MGWLARHWGEWGYSRGLLPGTIGTVAVLLTAALTAVTLRRFPLARLLAAAVVLAAGTGWLATH